MNSTFLPRGNKTMAKKRKGDDVLFGLPFEDAEEGEMPLTELDEFLVAGRDDKGGQVTVSVNVPPIFDRQLDVILHCRRFPYANKRDIVRHGMIRHCTWLHTIRKSIPRHIMSSLDATVEVCRDDEIATKIEQVFIALADRVAEHTGRGETSEAVRLISIVQQKLRDLKPTSWAKVYGERFNAKYGSYLHVHTTDEKVTMIRAREAAEA
jgi:hypothetical protein